MRHMMQRRSAWFLVISTAFFGGLFVFDITPAAAVVDACQCTCILPESRTDILRPPSQPLAGSSCAASVCPGACESSGLDLLEANYDSVKDQCQCACIEKTIEYTRYTSGNIDCTADCTEQCGGAALLDQNAASRKRATVGCTRDDDCTVGAFSEYEDVACILRPTTETGWPDDQKPTCLIPPTRENADFECRFNGGAAKGGICTNLGSGEDPRTNYITRPYLDATGRYQIIDYTTQNFTTVTALNTELRKPLPTGASPGVCQLYGRTIGVDVTSAGEDADFFTPDTGWYSAEGSDLYICAKRKRDDCGYTAPPASLTIKTARNYDCRDPDQYTATELSKVCFPQTTQYQDLCINSPGERCCAEAEGGCLDDSDCALDGSMKCVGANFPTYGICEWNTVCDSRSGSDADGQAYSDRRCRDAAATETASDDICTYYPTVGSISANTCPNPRQFCCDAPDRQALSSCGADIANNSDFEAAMSLHSEYDGSDPIGGYDAGDAWKHFNCVDTASLPELEFVDTPQTGRHLIDWRDGGSCLGSDVPSGGGLSGSTIRRCGEGRTCCNAVLLGGQQGLQEILDRPLPGEACGPEGGFVCRPAESIVADDLDAQKRGFPSVQEYYKAMAKSEFCQITPRSEGWYTTNDECTAENVCCDIKVNLQNFCTTDEQCNIDSATGAAVLDCAATPGSCPNKCDKFLKLCGDVATVDAGAGAGCFAAAQQEAANGQAILNLNPDTTEDLFTCQLVVADESGFYDDNVNSKCMDAGCGELNELPGFENETYLCCVPGVGTAPTAGAEVVAEEGEGAIDRSGGPIFVISSCIRSGDCSLGDMISTGVSFANFLIQISGSIFLAIFVYGGFMYLTAATSDRAGKGKTMIVQATVAMVLLLGAFVFISFIQNSLIRSVSRETVTGDECVAESKEGVNYACQYLPIGTEDVKALNDEITKRECVKQKCPGPANYVCCPQ